MKKVISAIVALLLFCSCMTAFSEQIEENLFSPDLTVDTSENTYASACYGLWKRELDVNGVQRSISIYTPQNYEPCCEMLLIFCPEGTSAVDFANKCGWPALAEKYGFGLTFYEGKDGGQWQLEDPQSEIDYYLAAAGVVGEREIIDSSEASLYIIGYGAGSTVAQYIALNYSSMFAGAMFMGGHDAISDAYIAEVGDSLSYPFAINSDFTLQLEGSFNKDVPMPVWIINDGDANDVLTQYWMDANDAVDDGMFNAYARIYEMNKLSLTETVNNKPISRVWISDIEGAASYFDADFEEFAWTKFFSRIKRFTSEMNGALRAAANQEDIGLIRNNVNIDGENRFWLAYAPSDYDGTEALPLVLAFPGHSISAELGAQQTELWRYAESRGFLVAFGQAGRCTNHTLSGCVSWRTGGDEFEHDVAYVKAIIAGMSEQYNVDSTRIYITGHSNGGSFAGALSKAYPELFAGCVNVGGLFTSYDELPEASAVKIPYLGIVGRYDLANMGVYEEGSLSYNDIRLRLALNGLPDSEAEIKETGSYKLISYRGTNLDIPLVQYMSNNIFHHSYTPQYASYAWDEIFSCYSRGADGTLYYLGKAVE